MLNLTFSHTLSPSAKTGDLMVQTILNSFSPEQKQMTLDLLKAGMAA
ncbi:putative zinc-finger protein [Candidatus Erwinia dacicola]|uniref:Zinc-finger protein n=1 Tax=Candidatus Erwinia dacicola TaxID=252393 RepID=A0A328TQL6_9GAMM|nr:putative zinc-finger protein [Candidatus Erwinia dacicola]